MSDGRRISQVRCRCSGLVAEVRLVGSRPVLHLAGGRAGSAPAEASKLRVQAEREQAMGDWLDDDAARTWADRYRSQADALESGARPKYRPRTVELPSGDGLDGGAVDFHRTSCKQCGRRYGVIVSLDGTDLRLARPNGEPL